MTVFHLLMSRDFVDQFIDAFYCVGKKQEGKIIKRGRTFSYRNQIQVGSHKFQNG